jgi:hypothetical protein
MSIFQKFKNACWLKVSLYSDGGISSKGGSLLLLENIIKNKSFSQQENLSTVLEEKENNFIMESAAMKQNVLYLTAIH